MFSCMSQREKPAEPANTSSQNSRCHPELVRPPAGGFQAISSILLAYITFLQNKGMISIQAFLNSECSDLNHNEAPDEPGGEANDEPDKAEPEGEGPRDDRHIEVHVSDQLSPEDRKSLKQRNR